MGNFDLRDNVEWKSRLIRGVRTEGQPYAVSRDDVDCKKTPRLITLLISKVTNYKMPERCLVLTKILIYPCLNQITSVPSDLQRNKFILLSFQRQEFDLNFICILHPSILFKFFIFGNFISDFSPYTHT